MSQEAKKLGIPLKVFRFLGLDRSQTMAARTLAGTSMPGKAVTHSSILAWDKGQR
jgi:hypothetical protein